MEKREETLNLYQKIQRCRVELQNCNLKKSGKNRFANFEYYELADFLPKVNELFDKYKLFSQFTLKSEIATLEVFDTETDKSVIFSSPVAEVNIKGSNAIQNLGGANTYMKRYLYLNLLEIVESDSFDAVAGKEQKKGVTFTPSTKEEETRVLDLMNKMKLLTYYQVESNSDMTINQLEDCVKKLEQKKKKIEMLKESDQEE